ncbi:MAG: dihydrodipicolinate synthase family protein [Candidatus Shikimatogenerans bostrichidophilus]|nr:MAG: dihydrodipicolinate synthase family protein [Candidatus Shikimatogenerans bostrichidophilus]
MEKIKISLPLITPFDNKYNIDFFSLEKLMLFINNLNNIDSIIIFDKFSEYFTIYNNEKIDLINCIQNNNKKNIKIYLKINNIYIFDEIDNIINQNIYKNIYYIILDYPNISNKIYKKKLF